MGCVSSSSSSVRPAQDPVNAPHSYDPSRDSTAEEQSDAATSDAESAALLNSRRQRRARAKDVQAAVHTLLQRAGIAIESGRPVRLVACLLNESQRHEARAQFWRAKHHKWREAIDVCHQKHGRFTYDLCLHGCNKMRREVGYISSIFDSWCYASSELGWKTTSESWLALHYLTMHHPGNHFLNGKFRNLCQSNRVVMTAAMDPNGRQLEELRAMPSRLCQVEALPGKDRYQRSNPGIRRKTMRRYVYQYIHDFYSTVGVATATPECVLTTGRVITCGGSSPPSPGVPPLHVSEPAQHAVVYDAVWYYGYPPPRDRVISAAVTLQQRLSRMEPSRDGNTRTVVVLINKLLCECGLHPAIFAAPDDAASLTAAEWREEMEAALERWEVYATGGGEDEATLSDRWVQIEKEEVRHRREAAADKANVDVSDRGENTSARRPWFDEDDKRRNTGAGHRPNRSEYECPIGVDTLQSNAYFTS